MSVLGLRENSSEEVTQAQVSPGQLGLCPDCNKTISRRAETCPHCGHYFGFLQKGWVMRIAGGIILGYIGIMILNVVLFFFLSILFAGFLSTILNNAPHK